MTYLHPAVRRGRMETVESRAGRKEKLLQDYGGSEQPRGLSALIAAACLVLSESDLGERACCIQRPSRVQNTEQG